MGDGPLEVGQPKVGIGQLPTSLTSGQTRIWQVVFEEVCLQGLDSFEKTRVHIQHLAYLVRIDTAMCALR